VTGLKNIPADGPLIYAINHQNALLDPLVIHSATWRNPYFLTRGDLFKNKLANRFLRSIKMLPIYRIRDGYDSVKMNEGTFEETKEILLRGGVIGIFPEGSHNLQYRLRPLKKGVTRIAFLAEQAAGFNLNLKIVPIGIQYESHFLSKGRTLVSIGEPIRVADFKEGYQLDQNIGIDGLLDSIHSSIKKLMLHFENRQDYDANLASFQKSRVYKRNLIEQLQSDQSLVSAIESGKDFVDTADSKFTIFTVPKIAWRFLWNLISFFPRYCTDLMVKKTVQDPHFYGTMRYAYSGLLYPVFFLLIYFLVNFLVF